MNLDLVLKNGHLLDPAQGLDKRADIGFKDGKIAAIDSHLTGKNTLDVSGKIITAGLIDLHTHVYYGGTSLSVDPMHLAKRGCTTLVDTGSAGAGNFLGFRQHVIEPCPVRIIAYLNISFAGIYGFSKRVMVGESGDQRLLAPIDTFEIANQNRDTIAGIKVRVGKHASGEAGLVPLEMAREVADELDMPMMVHIDVPPPTLEQVLNLMRKGDILTHCYRPFPNSPIDRDGKTKNYVLEARKRGVLFDIGHGMGSFSFEVARKMLANGFPPDTISSDVHMLCVDGPAFDLTTTMSKFLNLGMPLAEVITRSTSNAAKALNRHDLGSLKIGATGDASILTIEEGAFDYVDSVEERIIGKYKIQPHGIIYGGKPI